LSVQALSVQVLSAWAAWWLVFELWRPGSLFVEVLPLMQMER
jgi:hypothetical protein